MQFFNQSTHVWAWRTFDAVSEEGTIQPGETVSITFPEPIVSDARPGLRLETAVHPGSSYCAITLASSQLTLEQIGPVKVNSAGYGYTTSPADTDSAQCTLSDDLSVRIFATYQGGEMPTQGAFHASLKLPRD